MTINEKLDLIARAHELRERYFELLGHSNNIHRLREQISNITSTASIIAFLHPILTDVFPPVGESVYKREDAMELARRLIDLFASFHKEIESKILKKLSKFNIELEAEDETV